MNVKMLRELLSHLPDDAPIVVPDGDHSYRIASASVTSAGRVSERGRSHYCEWYGEEHAGDGEERIDALVVL
jgi:hypothetical protein